MDNRNKNIIYYFHIMYKFNILKYLRNKGAN